MMAFFNISKKKESLGDRVMKVNHAGEHGAICIYRAQRWLARFTAPDMLDEIDEFIQHEKSHRAVFEHELIRRGRPKCLSYHLCGLGGMFLGILTGLAGRKAIAATTVAVEAVVLRHLDEQRGWLNASDLAAVMAINQIYNDEKNHHDTALDRLETTNTMTNAIKLIVRGSTEVVIWLGMKL